MCTLALVALFVAAVLTVPAIARAVGAAALILLVAAMVAAIAEPAAPPKPPAIDPYKEGVRDYYNGTCYRARPYPHGTEKAALWDRGFQNAKRRDRNQVDRSHCRPSPAARGWTS
jgi:hypothetical protein